MALFPKSVNVYFGSTMAYGFVRKTRHVYHTQPMFMTTKVALIAAGTVMAPAIWPGYVVYDLNILEMKLSGTNIEDYNMVNLMDLLID